MLSFHSITNVASTKDNTLLASEELLSLGLGQALNIENIKPVHELVDKLATSCPSDTALTAANRSYTYRELKHWSDKVATNLLSKQENLPQRLAILMEPSAVMIASALGILKCGAAYVPLDITQPEKRITQLIMDANLSGILVDKKSVDKVREADCEVIIIEEDFIGIASDDLTLNVEGPTVSLDDAAYLIYTSGSTGQPKGVEVGHKELAHSTLVRRMVYPERSVFLLLSPIFCDSSIAGIWGTLTSGGHLVVASYEDCRDPEALIKTINKHQVTQILCIPSLYEGLLDIVEKSGRDVVKSLNTVIVAGETLHEPLVKRHFKLLGQNTSLINEYGPTESTVWASYHEFTSAAPVSIGLPLPGTSLYILNEDLKLVPKGEVGEIFIGGGQLAKGYFGNKEATKKAFLPDPFSGKKDARMYKTGDLAYWNDDGRLNFVGRKDHQVKIRGYRVELGAIEAVLRSSSHVREAVVIVTQDSTMLSAFVVCTEKISSQFLREMLASELPSHMLPSKIFIVDHLPLTSNGKVDRNALTQHMGGLEISASEEGQTSGDADEITEKVSKAWGELLKRDAIPEDANFFDLGGHSLMVFKLQQSLEKHTGFKPSVVALFRHTTINGQVAHILAETVNAQKNNRSLEVAA